MSRYPTNSFVYVRYFDDAWCVTETRQQVRDLLDAAPTSESWVTFTGAGDAHYFVDARAGDVIAVETEALDGDDEAAFKGEFPHS